MTGNDRSFQDIMKCYRLQPQAHSHVYRSVLLESRHQRHVSGEPAGGAESPTEAADGSKWSTSGRGAPVIPATRTRSACFSSAVAYLITSPVLNVYVSVARAR